MGVESLEKARSTGWGVVYAMLRDILIIDLCWEGLVNVLVSQEKRKSERSRQVDVHLPYDMEDSSPCLILDRRHPYMSQPAVQSHSQR